MGLNLYFNHKQKYLILLSKKSHAVNNDHKLIAKCVKPFMLSCVTAYILTSGKIDYDTEDVKDAYLKAWAFINHLKDLGMLNNNTL